MKKLIIACCAVLALGCCMMVGGWAAGGQLYGSYYGGELHPVSESIRDASRTLDRLRFHTWWDSDRISEFVDDTVDEAVNDALDDIDTDWVDGWLEKRQEAIASPDIPIQSVDQIKKLEFTFTGGDITIETGSDFDLSGDFTVQNSSLDHNNWELELAAGSDGATLTLPDSIASYQSIELEIAGGSVTISDPLRSTEMDITVGAGSFDADELDATSLEIEVGAGEVYAYLSGSASQYRIQGKASMGSIVFNDEEIAGGGLGTYRYDNRSTVGNATCELDLNVGAGTIDLHTIA